MGDSMKAFVGVTDNDWFELLASLPDADGVNFWQPSSGDFCVARGLCTGPGFSGSDGIVLGRESRNLA